MLGGVQVTETTREHAREMLNNSRSYKLHKTGEKRC
jgi:hypothetical protein